MWWGLKKRKNFNGSVSWQQCQKKGQNKYYRNVRVNKKQYSKKKQKKVQEKRTECNNYQEAWGAENFFGNRKLQKT